jgi:N-methylhydantoinase B
VLPEASVVNACFPAACGMRFTTAMRVHDLVLGALNRAMPGKVPVAGSGVLVVTYISTSELGGAGRVVVANPVSGGSGASGERDGISGTEMSVATCERAGRGARSRGAGKCAVWLAPDSGPGSLQRLGAWGDRLRCAVVRGAKDRHRCAWGADGGAAGTTAAISAQGAGRASTSASAPSTAPTRRSDPAVGRRRGS